MTENITYPYTRVVKVYFLTNHGHKPSKTEIPEFSAMCVKALSLVIFLFSFQSKKRSIYLHYIWFKTVTSSPTIYNNPGTLELWLLTSSLQTSIEI